MATALEVIRRSLRLIQAIAAGEEPTADEGQDALTALNRMMHGFPAVGIERTHTTIAALSDTLNLPDEEIDAIEYMLAVRLAPEWERPVSDEVKDMAESLRRYLQGLYVRVPEVAVDEGLLNMSSQQTSDWNINNGQ